jgi:hypothetical protein
MKVRVTFNRHQVVEALSLYASELGVEVPQDVCLEVRVKGAEERPGGTWKDTEIMGIELTREP